jgi:hypothetical protein
MENIMESYSDKSNAELIRATFKEVGENHKNRFLKDLLREKYNRDISISQIAAVLGRYEDRGVIGNENVHNLCRRFLVGCKNDIGLAKKVLASYE